MDVFIQSNDNDPKWRLTGFYGAPDIREKEVTWNLLRRLGRGQTISWLGFGDFNEILYSTKKKGECRGR